MRPKVSIIIPVYNASKFIERCAKSLFEQSLDSIEFIYVDDASTDDSVDIIRSVASNYPERIDNVKIIQSPHNVGVGRARQIGLENSTGQYIVHCDSDDWMSPDMCQVMYTEGIAQEADIVICNYNKVCGGNCTQVSLDYNHVQKPSFCISPIEGAVWNKLVKRDLIFENNIYFSNLTLGEDFLFITKCRLLSSKTIIIERPLYNYSIENTDSITRHYDEIKCQSVISVCTEMEKFLYEHDIFDRYSYHLNFLKFQARSFYIIDKQNRDINKYGSTFPESDIYLMKYPIPTYRKIIGKLVKHKYVRTASMLLRLRDQLSK